MNVIFSRYQRVVPYGFILSGGGEFIRQCVVFLIGVYNLGLAFQLVAKLIIKLMFQMFTDHNY